jgi:glycosyltransferase involved in cell wall biosynthesis
MDWSEDNDTMGDVLIALEFPVHLIRHPRKVVWLTRPRFCPAGVGSASDAAILEACHEAHRLALSEASKVFSISATASYQLRTTTECDAIPLVPPPPSLEDFYWERAEDFVLVPAGVRPHERLELILEALVRTREQVQVRFCGDADDPGLRNRLLHSAKRQELRNRIEYLGEVDDAMLPDLYARSRAILFPPHDEPSAWATLHAMLASKATITCYDSGAPAEHVEHGLTGWIVDPDPEELAAILDALWSDPDRARVYGINARSVVETLPLDWEYVLTELLGFPPSSGA